METKDKIDKIDMGEFIKWITENINLILNRKQTNLFRNTNMSFEDIKLFGKNNIPSRYYDLYKNEFERSQFNWIIETSWSVAQ